MKNLKELLNEKKVYLFGAGYRGKLCADLMSFLGFKVDLFVDNDEKKRGDNIGGISIVHPSDLSAEDLDCAIIIITVMKGIDPIREQISALGISDRNIIVYDDILKDEDIVQCFKENVCKAYDSCIHIGKYAHDSKTRVLLDAQAFAFQTRGGISRYIHELVKGLSGYTDIGLSFFEGIHISELECDNEVDRIDCGHPDSLFCDYDLRRRANKILINRLCDKRDTYDIYHPGYYEDYGITKYRKKIVTVHDMIHELFGINEDTVIKKKSMIESADGIIAVSENTKKDLMEILGVPEDKIRVIYHGNSLTMEPVKYSGSDEPYILYVGSRDKYKNFKCLIKAYAASVYRKHVRLICFGGGDFNREEKELFDDLQISGRVLSAHGNDEVLAGVYAGADLFVYPSLYEGFGMPLLEAMHYGTPIITSNVSSLPEVAGDAAEYFDPNSAEELKDTIDRLLGDKSRQRELKEKGFLREKEFSWDKAVRETYEFYKQVLGSAVS